MCIDTNAGIRHAAQLLQDGARLEDVMASLPNFPPKFAEGMRRVLEDPVVQVELMKREKGENLTRPIGPKPGIFKNQEGMFDLWMEDGAALVFHGVFSTPAAARAYRDEARKEAAKMLGAAEVDKKFPGLEKRRNRWRVNRMVEGRRYCTKGFLTVEEAIRAWAEMALYIEQESQKATITGVGRNNGH